jgi:acyl-CoA dehydrogenase
MQVINPPWVPFELVDTAGDDVSKELPLLDFDALRPPCERITGVHDAWRCKLRQFFNERIAPFLDDWSASGTFPDEVYHQAAAAGILGMGFPEALGGSNEGADLYHRIIFAEELHRLGSGVVFADLATHWIGLPPVVKQGDPRLDEAVVRPILAGQKKIAFAVTEPGGGSDVSRITCQAEKTPDGFRVSGTKTLISGALRADFFLTAVRTGGEGMQGISLLLMDAKVEGIRREPVPGLQWYNASVGTIHFDQAPVASHGLIGPENQGFFGLLPQFNIERFSGVAAALAMARASAAEAIAFAKERQVFGQRLIDHQATRHKLVDMVRALRVAYSYLDHCVERFERGENMVADLCMLKVQATTTLEHVAREALHVLGGTAYQGSARLERIYRESRIFAVGGGTEEVLRDMTAKQLKF